MDNNNDNNGESTSNETGGQVFTTVFGLKEEDFVRTSAKGNYTPTINEIDDIVIKGDIKFNELRLLTFIKGKTISFRNTHTRMTRKSIYEELGLAKPKFYDALNGLISKEYLLERADKDGYYFYALNPKTFGGIIVLRSIGDASFRLNQNEKRASGTLTVPNASTKKVLERYQKGTQLVPKWYPEDALTIRNYSAFGTLKYILIKYILLKQLSAAKAESVASLFEEIQNPEYMIQQYATLIYRHPLDSRWIVEESLRAKREGTDASGKPIKSNAVVYVVTCWDQIKHHWSNSHHSLDMSPEAVEKRNEHYEAIMAYPIRNNVVKLQKKQLA